VKSSLRVAVILIFHHISLSMTHHLLQYRSYIMIAASRESQVPVGRRTCVWRVSVPEENEHGNANNLWVT
jgi:hypothetical protein